MYKSLIAALLLGVASLTLTGCGDDDKPQETAIKIYKSVGECQEDDNTESDCKSAIEGATTLHESSAPHIPTREECVARYGIDACTQRHDSSGNSWFAPAMAGFVVGHIVGGMFTPHQPIYVDRSGNAYSGTNSVGNWRSSCTDPRSSCHNGGYVSVPPRSTWSSSYRTTTIVTTTVPGKPPVAMVAPPPSSRGGFGGSAASSASGGLGSLGKSATSAAPAPSSFSPKPSISSGSSSSGGGISMRGGFGGRAGGGSVGG